MAPYVGGEAMAWLVFTHVRHDSLIHLYVWHDSFIHIGRCDIHDRNGAVCGRGSYVVADGLPLDCGPGICHVMRMNETITHVSESWSHIWMNRITYVNESCGVYERGLTCICRFTRFTAGQVCMGKDKSVEVCCSVLQCVAACCSVLQRVAVCCNV